MSCTPAERNVDISGSLAKGSTFAETSKKTQRIVPTGIACVEGIL